MKISRSREDKVVAYNQTNYESAVDHIRCAIDSLGAYVNATQDDVAKESIANLGVVLLDLKSNTK